MFQRCLMAIPVAVLALAWSGAGRAEKATDAGAVIARAIQAAGGEDKLARFQAATWTEKGTFYGAGADGVPYTGHYAVQWPHQFKMEIENFFTMVINGDKGWSDMGGGATEMPKAQMDEQKENHHSGWITTLLPLKDKAFHLTLLDEAKVNDKPAVGVKVSGAGHRDVLLYFDRASGLLVKSQMRGKDVEQGGKEFVQESLYQDYQDVDGVKMPMKLVIQRDGARYLEAQHSDLKAAGHLADDVFKKP